MFLYSWRLVSLAGLLLLLIFNHAWFSLNPRVPESCQRQIDHFSGQVETDSNNKTETLRLIKVEIWCRGQFVSWPSAELRFADLRNRKLRWFRMGDRIQLKHIGIQARNSVALDIKPEPGVSIYNLTRQERILRRGPLLLYVQNKARYFLGPFPAAVYKALITADRTSLTIDWRNRIKDLGITHLFAISGMHIGILFLWFSMVIRWLVSFPCTWVEKGTSVFLTDLVSITAIFVFLRVIGMPISAERSFIMLAWWALMRHFLRWQPLWFILCGTGMIILVGSPIAIGQKSFQLSFLSVAGIIQILPFLPRRRIQDSLGSALRKLVLSSLIVSAWLCLLTLPLVSQLAENVSLISAINNVIHIFYLSFVFFPCSLLVMFFTVLGYPWGGLPGELYLYSLLNFLGKIWEQGLVLNSEWNRYFLIENFTEWPLFSALVWFVLFLTPFFIKWMAREKRKI